TKQCSDCHVSANNDNNAWMAQLLLQGSNFMNFMGRYVYVATGKKGFEAIAVAEHDEPEAIYGSDLQRIAYPGNYKNFLDHHRELSAAAEHPGNVLDIQTRGEYAYAALGPGGFRVYDIANIDNKSFSEKVVTAPVSPIGQRFYVPTKNALAVASPTTLAVDPLRQQLPENEEQPMHLLYGFLYVADKEEGLVIIGDPNLKSKSPGVGTLLDGNPANNFLKRAVTFNPGGALTGARRIAIAGTFAYILTDKTLVVVDLDNPLAPRVTANIGAPALNAPRGIAVQFRYAFIVDRDGLKVLDVTDLAQPKPISSALIPLEDARNVYVARTYAYVSAGKQGLAIVDVEKPDVPKLDQLFTAEGQLNDVNDVKIGMVAASAFAFIADGKNGLRVLQILSPWDDPGHFSGFSPRPTPKLIATAHTRGPALAISKGLDRDRAVDESGNQLAVFGRRGARPLNRAESQSLYLHGGRLYSVADSSPTRP
ncbi:MAG: repeat protein, partial [Candidatus Acidoferrum typicum]|nr:repeat protein [Candidatus Acidoferrum typicum]